MGGRGAQSRAGAGVGLSCAAASPTTASDDHGPFRMARDEIRQSEALAIASPCSLVPSYTITVGHFTGPGPGTGPSSAIAIAVAIAVAIAIAIAVAIALLIHGNSFVDLNAVYAEPAVYLLLVRHACKVDIGVYVDGGLLRRVMTWRWGWGWRWRRVGGESGVRSS